MTAFRQLRRSVGGHRLRGSCLRRNDEVGRSLTRTPHTSTLTLALSPCRERGFSGAAEGAAGFQEAFAHGAGAGLAIQADELGLGFIPVRRLPISSYISTRRACCPRESSLNRSFVSARRSTLSAGKLAKPFVGLCAKDVLPAGNVAQAFVHLFVGAFQAADTLLHRGCGLGRHRFVAPQHRTTPAQPERSAPYAP